MGEPVPAQVNGDASAPGSRVDSRVAAHHSPLTARVVSDLIGVADALVVALSGVATGSVYYHYIEPLSGGLNRVVGLSLLCALVFFALGRREGAYDLNRLRRFTHEGATLLTRWSIAMLALVALGFLLKISGTTSRGWLFAWYGAGVVTLLGARVAWRQLARRLFQQSPALRRRVAIVGSNEIAQRVFTQLHRTSAGVEIE